MKKPILGVISLAMLLVYGLVGLVVVAVAAAFIVPLLLDWNDYKADITEAVREATGRELTIDGDIAVSLLPWPEASAEGVHLSNPGGAEAGEMLSLRSVEAEIALWPLVGGAVEVESLTLVGADVTLEQAADGSANWDFATPGAEAAAESDGGGDFDLSLDGFTIEDSRIRYLDAGEEVAALEAIDAELSAESLAGPFAAVGTAEVNGLPVAFDIGLGGLDAAPEVALRLTWDDGASELAVNGSLEGGGFTGQVVLAAEDGRRLAEAAGLDAGDVPGGKLSVFTALSVSEQGITAEQLALTLGESRLSGHARFTQASDALGASFDVALAGDRLDLDALGLAEAASAPAAADAAAEDAGAVGFALPEGMTGTLALDLGAVTINGDSITDLALAATLDGGALRLDQAAATLPGNSRVAVDGIVTAREGVPYFEGSAELTSPALRILLAWLGVDVSRMPDGALQSMSFGSGVAGGPDSVRLDGFSLALDDIQAAGSAALGLAGKPSIALTATVDRLDLDRYSGGGGGGAEGDAAGGNPLDAVNADVDLSFGALSIGGNAYESVQAVALVQDGGLTIERLTGSGPGGTAFSLSGSVSDPSAPAFALTFDVSHPNLRQLAVAFGLDGAGLPAAAMSAAGTAQSDGAQLSVTDLYATIGRSDVNGTITGVLGSPATIDAGLSSGVLDLDEVFPSGGGGGGGGERWPTEPIDLAALRGVNGDVAWSVGRLSMAPTGLDNAQLAATLSDGVLTITELTGGIGGGLFSVDGRIDSSGVGVALAISADSVTFDPGVLAIGGVSIDGAQIDFDLNVNAVGASVAELISSMDGTAALSVGGGVINGFNLGAWQDAINGLRGGLGGGLAGLQGMLGTLTGGFDQGLSGGQTAIGSLTGTFAINDGVISSNDLKLATDVAVVELDGSVSLPAWSLGSDGLATLQRLVFDDVPSIPFTLGGTLDSPTFAPDFAALQVFLATSEMGLSLDQLPADLLSGLSLDGLSGEALQSLDPQAVIDALSGGGGLGPEALQGLLGGGAAGQGGGVPGLPDPGALIEGLTGGDGGAPGLPDPGALIEDLTGGGSGEGMLPDPAQALEGLLGGGSEGDEGTVVVPEPPAATEETAQPEPVSEPEEGGSEDAPDAADQAQPDGTSPPGPDAAEETLPEGPDADAAAEEAGPGSEAEEAAPEEVEPEEVEAPQEAGPSEAVSEDAAGDADSQAPVPGAEDAGAADGGAGQADEEELLTDQPSADEADGASEGAEQQDAAAPAEDPAAVPRTDDGAPPEGDEELLLEGAGEAAEELLEGAEGAADDVRDVVEDLLPTF